MLHYQLERPIVFIFLFSLYCGSQKVKHCLEEVKMKESVYKSYDDLLLFFNASLVA